MTFKNYSQEKVLNFYKKSTLAIWFNQIIKTVARKPLVMRCESPTKMWVFSGMELILGTSVTDVLNPGIVYRCRGEFCVVCISCSVNQDLKKIILYYNCQLFPTFKLLF